MSSAQTPIGSGFGAHSTAQEVLAGQDLSGSTAVVTGGHSGLGLETTRALAGAGAHVIVGARDVDAARQALLGLDRVEARALDLTDLASVRRFAEDIVASGRRVRYVINSAGVMACPQTRVGPGAELQFATNHLGHFALVNLLWPAIADGGRVVSVSSAGHHFSPIRWDDINFLQGYDKWQAYGQSKTANVLFAVHLDLLGRERGIHAFALHPGAIITPLQRHVPREEMIALGWMTEDGAPANPDALKTPQQGAATQVWAATSPLLEGKGGRYCEDCDVAVLASDDPQALSGVKPYAIDRVQAQRLWELSARLTGIDMISR
ncbi:SDR family NAD(P)-dependent oxidoreductase [Stenotrophomonas maltophilia]|uniref:SDR family NAD(P)-dependent oxidoreductase n=1 Tax=Stenotrophomonas maltophilia TaxID=40324 RepID=UPI002893859B|nr:SDR family NAD(P)-dependent oxidoreductase [Stenotrophomonas maltophilia]MDT3500603.1 SDR family NAD(P)-dependent oxidoreductase [Stenotrophomonas maltophilia]